MLRLLLQIFIAASRKICDRTCNLLLVTFIWGAARVFILFLDVRSTVIPVFAFLISTVKEGGLNRWRWNILSNLLQLLLQLVVLRVNVFTFASSVAIRRSFLLLCKIFLIKYKKWCPHTSTRDSSLILFNSSACILFNAFNSLLKPLVLRPISNLCSDFKRLMAFLCSD